jgi:hypothetical protein
LHAAIDAALADTLLPEDLAAAIGIERVHDPDFWPATMARRPFGSETRIGGEAKSKSGASLLVQLV